ncbi:restriction endonuclease subunit S [Cyanobacterium aponinum]|uniref:restriction endonuclease subunit S n=1 Tax=Cyanobacterium aponinum TaxID=379064 RepID=UPI000C12D6C1|nr:restriction endonuclease subunit S [Cyanobacterium aponinum]PHV61300.1 restriction endonuclease subunit S [Cyanobacterium aponinum IPPAS B-1201]
MMLSLPKYDCYKDSGVDWLGEIPEHWGITRMANFGSFTKGKGISKNDISEQGLPALLYGDIYTKYNIKTDHLITSVPKYIVSNSVPIYFDDILFTGSGETLEDIGKCIVYKGNSVGYAGGDVIIFRQNKCNSLYLSYLFNSSFFNEQKAKLAKGEIIVHIYSSKLKTIKFCLPPLEEQEKIVKFLDRKCEEVESAIALKQRLIELLDEQTSIVINQAVTKGLNPNAPMKDSGIDWLGDIPAHWEVLRTKNIFRLITQPAPNNNNYELLSVYTDIGVKPRKELEERGNKASTTDGYWMVKKGDIVVNKLLAWMGAIGISDYDGVTSPAYDILRPYKPVESKFYHYLFRNPICLSKLKQHSKGIMEMRLRLYFDEFGNIKLPYPSFEEQEKIVKYLENKIAEIEELKEKTLQQIEKLKEFKQILIAEVVTGKIKV